MEKLDSGIAFKLKSIDLIKDEASTKLYNSPGSFLYIQELEKMYDGIVNNLQMAIGQGPSNSSFQSLMTRIDRYKNLYFNPNNEQVGLTFITRPNLNLSPSNIRLNRILNVLDTTNPITRRNNVRNINFAIRCLLDTYFCLSNVEDAFLSPLIDPCNPFLNPIMNCLTDISGFEDINLETETTEGGFHNENLTFAKGCSMLNSSSELSLGFKDVQGSIVLSIFYFWVLTIALQCRGTIMSHLDYIHQRRMNYTVSIYRFLLDPSRKYITKWAKATGCFPKNVPIGACFNFNENDSTIDASRKFTIQFVCNKVEYNDFAILKDFNFLMRKYAKGIDTSSYTKVDDYIENNLIGYPYIVTDNNGYIRMEFRALDTDITNYQKNIYDVDKDMESFTTLSKERKTSMIKELQTKYGDITEADQYFIDNN